MNDTNTRILSNVHKRILSKLQQKTSWERNELQERLLRAQRGLTGITFLWAALGLSFLGIGAVNHNEPTVAATVLMISFVSLLTGTYLMARSER